MIIVECKFGKVKLQKPTPPEIIALLVLVGFVTFLVVRLR